MTAQLPQTSRLAHRDGSSIPSAAAVRSSRRTVDGYGPRPTRRAVRSFNSHCRCGAVLASAKECWANRGQTGHWGASPLPRLARTFAASSSLLCFGFSECRKTARIAAGWNFRERQRTFLTNHFDGIAAIDLFAGGARINSSFRPPPRHSPPARSRHDEGSLSGTASCGLIMRERGLPGPG
jgi:hypothetical protein